jgi:sugar phosphate permease
VVAATAFLVLLAAAGIRATPGVLMVPLEQEFGWSPATISAAVALNLVLFGLCGPFAAAAMQRFGIRKVVAFALVVNAVSVAATSFVRTPGELVLLWGLCVGLATGLTANVFAAMVATRWFVKSRGVVVGVLSASISTGQMIFLPTLAWLATVHGWRASVWLVAGCALIVLVPAVLLLRDFPSDLGLPAYGAARVEVPAPPSGNPIVTAVRELQSAAGVRDFQLLFMTFFVCGASTNGLLGTHLIAACGDHGIAEVTAAGFLATMGILDIIGTACSGYLSDRFDSRVLLFWYYSLRGLSLMFLPFALAAAGPYLWVFTAFYGLDWIATIPPTLKLTNNAFGSTRGPLLYGWIAAGHQIGASVAALGAGIIRTSLGSYDTSFWFAGALCIVAALAALAIGRSPRPAPGGALEV